MKKIYSTIMMLAMMVAALSLTACSSDDDNDEGSAQKTLTIDGKSYYGGCVKDWSGGTVDQNRYGMYLEISARENIYIAKGYRLTLSISPTKVSELSVGQIFTYDEIGVRTFRSLSQIGSDSYSWDALNGEILIKDIKTAELTIQIKNLPEFGISCIKTA